MPLLPAADKVRSDVVVIGAGVIGSSIALHLSRAGMKVVVVDKSASVGHGSTSASSAVVRFNFSTWDGVAAAWESKYYWEQWRDHLKVGDDRGYARYHRTGLAMLDVEIAPRDGYLHHFRRAGIPFEEWDSDMLLRNVPGIDAGRYWPPKRVDDEAFWASTDETLGAVYTPDAGFVNDPQLAAHNLANAAVHEGANFLLKRRVTGVIESGDRAAGVRLDGDELIHAPIVVNAAGPWSGSVNQMAGVGDDFTIGLRPLRQEVHHVTAPPGYNSADSLGVAVADVDLGTYMRPETGNGMLVGGTEPECDPMQWLDDPDDANVNPTKAVFDAQVTRAARRFSELGVPSRPRGIVGVYDVADDWTPIYDRTSMDGFYVAVGTSGNQFKNAPLVGQLMAAIIDGVENGVDHDLSPVQFVTEHTGAIINLGAFSRKRPINTESSGTVMG